MLHSSEPKGSLYIETKNLDGETNLKNKYVNKNLVDKFDFDNLGKASFKINSELPNKAIYKYEGVFEF